MKKFLKYITISFTTLCLLCSFIPVSAVDIQCDYKGLENFVQIQPSNISKNVCVYENNITGEKCAIFNPSDFTEGDTIVLYNDEEIGEKVQITIISQKSQKNLRTSNDTGWSAGYIPSGFGTYRAEMDAPLITVKYDVDVNAYPVNMLNAYNTRVSTLICHINDIDTYVGRSSATNSAPAYSTCEFLITAEQAGIIGGSVAGYLTFQINSLGQCRAQWAC